MCTVEALFFFLKALAQHVRGRIIPTIRIGVVDMSFVSNVQ